MFFQRDRLDLSKIELKEINKHEFKNSTLLSFINLTFKKKFKHVSTTYYEKSKKNFFNKNYVLRVDGIYFDIKNTSGNTNDLNNMKLLLKAIFTSKELKEFDNRLKIFQLLMQGKKHREISENLNVGIATVTRGSLAFEKEEIFKMKTNIIDILRSKKIDNDK